MSILSGNVLQFYSRNVLKFGKKEIVFPTSGKALQFYFRNAWKIRKISLEWLRINASITKIE